MSKCISYIIKIVQTVGRYNKAALEAKNMQVESVTQKQLITLYISNDTQPTSCTLYKHT